MERIVDGYRLSTGREFYANRGIVGLSDSDDENVTEGYDGGIDMDASGEGQEWGQSAWSEAERHELADYMIEKWTRWKERR